MKKIYLLANKYPTELEPNACVFIQQLAWTFNDLGYRCEVINPLPINLNPKNIMINSKIIEKTDNNNEVVVYHPKYFSLGQSVKIFQKIRIRMTTFLFQKSVEKIIKKNNNKDFIIYGHFICPPGVVAAKLGNKYNVDSFFAHGEAIYSGNYKYGNNYLKRVFKSMSGVIAVSTQNKANLVNSKIIETEKIKVFPNGYRKERFYKIEKSLARKHFGWDSSYFVVGFCGSFDNRKGVIRLQEAVDSIDNDKVVFACAGSGKLRPTSNKCIFKDKINNDELIYFYNAIDVFALPTLNEGCCNAIIEAMACGCPIISSDKLFNYDILDDENSIMINPNDIVALKNAIINLYNDKRKLKKLTVGCLKKSSKLTLEDRTRKIAKFIFK